MRGTRELTRGRARPGVAQERTKNAQFVIISLRNNMFELADRLVGIYKTDNCTKSLAINPGAFTVGSGSGGAAEPPVVLKPLVV